MAIVAALGAIAFVSCRNENGTEHAKAEANLGTAPLAEQAVLLAFDTQAPSNDDPDNRVVIPGGVEAFGGDAPIDDNVEEVLEKGEFSNSGYFFGNTVFVEKTKAGSVPEGRTIVEPYTYKDGVYVIENFGTIKIVDNKIVVTLMVKKDGETKPVTYEVTPEEVNKAANKNEAGSIAFNLCRKWTVDRIVVSVKGGKLGETGVGIKKDAPIKLDEVAKMLEDQKVNIPKNINLSDYDIVDINFTEFGTFNVNFTKADPFKGVFTLKSKDFEYKLSGGQGNYLINGEAKGNVDFYSIDNVNFCQCNISGKIENGSDVYTSSVELTLKELK